MSAVEKLPAAASAGIGPSVGTRLRGAFKTEHLLYVASIAGMVVLWHVIATSFFKPEFFPPPAVVLDTGIGKWCAAASCSSTLTSMQRILLGFFIGSALAAPIGLLMGSVRKVRIIFDPYTQFFRFVPSLAWLTPVVLWFGVGETSKVLIIIYTTMFIVLINTIVGVAQHRAQQIARRRMPRLNGSVKAFHPRHITGDVAVHPDRDAPGDGQLFRHGGGGRDDRGG